MCVVLSWSLLFPPGGDGGLSSLLFVLCLDNTGECKVKKDNIKTENIFTRNTIVSVVGKSGYANNIITMAMACCCTLDPF